jgi:uncharacterized protein DUF5343
MAGFQVTLHGRFWVITEEFLSQLDFNSSNDRLFISLLKALSFVDESGVPTKRYYEFLDQSQSGRVLAEAVREAYSDLFAVNKNAQDMTVEEVKNKLRTLTLGQKSENVVSLMANTFKALTSLADWETPPAEPPAAVPSAEVPPLPSAVEPSLSPLPGVPSHGLQLHYDIQIHLPESRDPAVFDAIFQALRKHLL